MTQVYTIINQQDRIEPDIFFQVAASNTRGHEQKLKKPRHNTNLRGQTFSHRIVADWNALPAEVIKSPSLNTFKQDLTELGKTINTPTTSKSRRHQMQKLDNVHSNYTCILSHRQLPENKIKSVANISKRE